MIIGRLRKHLAQQDWFAVTVDVVVVIVSILLAFQIERWADELRNQGLEQDYLVRLKHDLETEITRMDQALDSAEERIQAAKFLDRAINDSSIVIGLPESLTCILHEELV